MNENRKTGDSFKRELSIRLIPIGNGMNVLYISLLQLNTIFIGERSLI